MLPIIFLAVLLVSLQTPQNVKAQDFKQFCAKATTPSNIQSLAECFIKIIPPKIIGIFDACIKMQSNADFPGFIKQACENEKVLESWIKCQAGKFKKEYKPTADDIKALTSLAPCVEAI